MMRNVGNTDNPTVEGPGNLSMCHSGISACLVHPARDGRWTRSWPLLRIDQDLTRPEDRSDPTERLDAERVEGEYQPSQCRARTHALSNPARERRTDRRIAEADGPRRHLGGHPLSDARPVDRFVVRALLVGDNAEALANATASDHFVDR